MLVEHDRIVLTHDLPFDSLEAGDVGTVIHVHRAGEAYEVEFMSLSGHTAAIATVEADQLRPVSASDLTHARTLTAV